MVLFGPESVSVGFTIFSIHILYNYYFINIIVFPNYEKNVAPTPLCSIMLIMLVLQLLTLLPAYPLILIFHSSSSFLTGIFYLLRMKGRLLLVPFQDL